MKKAFIIHGWEGKPDSNWFPWLKQELEKSGFSVEVPEMPNAAHPQMEGWIAHLQKTIATPDKNTYLIGHSLGGTAILRYLENIGSNIIGAAVLVAAVVESVGIEETGSFFETPMDFGKIKKGAKHFVAINSDNDPYIPLEQGEILRDRLGAKLIVMKDAGHLNAGDGYFQLPIALEEILRISR